MLIGIKEPYKINSTHIPSMIAMTYPLQGGEPTKNKKKVKHVNTLKLNCFRIKHCIINMIINLVGIGITVGVLMSRVI